MTEHFKKHLLRLLKIDFIRFCIVGGTGFLINLFLLVVLRDSLKLAVEIAQLIAAEIALFSNFLLHHHWTYKRNHVDKSFPKLLVQFHVSTWPAILGSTAMVSIGETVFHLGNLPALMVSSIIALLWNFGWSKFVIWRDVAPAKAPDLVS